MDEFEKVKSLLDQASKRNAGDAMAVDAAKAVVDVFKRLVVALEGCRDALQQLAANDAADSAIDDAVDAAVGSKGQPG